MPIERLVPISGGFGMGWFAAKETAMTSWEALILMLVVFAAGKIATAYRDQVTHHV